MKLKELYLNFWLRNIVLLFGILLFLAPLNYDSEYGWDLKELLKMSLQTFCLYISILLHNLCFNYYFSNKKYLFYSILAVVIIGSYITFDRYTEYGLVVNYEWVSSIIFDTIFFVFGLGCYFIHKNILARNIYYQKKLLQKDEEIFFLKAQMNPHFLFNALNNLYGIALSEPERVSDKILELSELLRYQVTASKKEKVALLEELDHLKWYLNYEKQRNNKININTKINVDHNDILIAPLLLLAFVENAIKFSQETDNPMIQINADLKSDKFTFVIQNNYDPNSNKIKGTNTGVNNTKKRLELLYPKCFSLKISNKNASYIVELSIKLL